MQFVFPGWGLNMQNPASADPAQVAAGGAEHQALLDDLQGLSGDESFHTAASQQAAETADADSNEHAAASSGAMLPRLTRLDTHQAQLAAPDSAMRSHSATANAHSAAAVGQSAPVPVNEQQGADAAQAADPHAAGLLHLPLDVLHLVLLRLQPRDWCALAAASKQLRPLAQANELWALCDPTYVRQQEAAARRQEAAVARRRGSRALSLLPVPMTSIRAAARGRKRRLSTSKGTLDGGDAVSDAAGGGFGVDATGASSEAEGIRIRQRRKRQLDQRKADGAGSDTDGEWLAPLSGGGSSADFGRAAAGGGGGSFIGGSGGGQLQDGPAGTSAAAGWPQHPPAHLILLPMLEQAAPTAAAVPHAQALAPAAAVVPAAAAITPLAGIRALQQPGGGVRLFYQRDGPRGQHQALRAALSAAATAAPWLPRRLAQQFLYGGRPQRGAAAGAEAGPAGSGTSSTHAHSPADGAEDVFKAAQGLQLQLAKSQAVSGQIGRRFDSMWQTHDQLRIALCDLWAEGELTECSDLRRSITKLTRISWALTYEAVAAAFTAAADTLALQLTALAAVREDGRTLWLAVLAAWRHYTEWLCAVVPLMGLLSECVSAEQAAEFMARGTQDTPSLPHLGRIAFRSQVLLSYGLRGRLQAALLPQPAAISAAGTARRAATGIISSPPVLHASQNEMLPASAAALEPQILQLLHEVDVPDDATRARAGRTRNKLRRVFGLEAGAAQLTLSWRLRVPPL